MNQSSRLILESSKDYLAIIEATLLLKNYTLASLSSTFHAFRHCPLVEECWLKGGSSTPNYVAPPCTFSMLTNKGEAVSFVKEFSNLI